VIRQLVLVCVQGEILKLGSHNIPRRLRIASTTTDGVEYL
jgi:hypothetical protein